MPRNTYEVPGKGRSGYIVSELQHEYGELESLSGAWANMTPEQREHVVDQVLTCRRKLRGVELVDPSPPLTKTIRHTGQREVLCTGVACEETWSLDKMPLISTVPDWTDFEQLMMHDTFKCVSRPVPAAESKWKVSGGLDSRCNDATRKYTLPLFFSLFEQYIQERAEFVCNGGSVWLCNEGAYAEPVVFTVDEIRELMSRRNARLQHCSLDPDHIIVVRRRGRPSSYKVAAIIDWECARFAPIGYDVAMLDAKLGTGIGGDVYGSYYRYVRSRALNWQLCEEYDRSQDSFCRGDNALMKFLEAAHMFSTAKNSALIPPGQTLPRKPLPAAQTWMQKQGYRWANFDKGYIRRPAGQSARSAVGQSAGGLLSRLLSTKSTK